MFNDLCHHLKSWLRPLSSTQVERAARSVAEQSLSEVRRRMSSAAATMNRHQLLGYTRARARRPIAHHVQTLAQLDPAYTPAVQQDLIARTLELVVQRLHREALLHKAPVVLERRAAA